MQRTQSPAPAAAAVLVRCAPPARGQAPPCSQVGGVMQRDLESFMDTTKLRQLLDAFSAATGVAVAVLDVDGTILVKSGWQRICSEFHRANPKTLARCQESDAFINSHLIADEPVIYECANGLIDIAFPVRFKGRHLANFYLGQISHQKPDPDKFLSQALRYGFDPESYLAALDEVPVIPREQAERLIEFFTTLVGMVTDLGHEITARRLAEEELRQARDGLEVKVAERTGELAQANRELTLEARRHQKTARALLESERKLADIIDFLPDPAWVIDIDGVVMAWNRAAVKLTGVAAEDMVGKGNYEYALPFYATRRPILCDLVLERNRQWEPVYLHLEEKDGRLTSSESWHPMLGENGTYLAGSAAPLFDAAGNLVGAVETVRDITAIKRNELERERLIEELQEALASVKTLKGLLPICASCKKVRDDAGYWNQIESYIAKHSEAEFSHGLCPECVQKYFPGVKVAGPGNPRRSD